jgi:hypothetical protein
MFNRIVEIVFLINPKPLSKNSLATLFSVCEKFDSEIGIAVY